MKAKKFLDHLYKQLFLATNELNTLNEIKDFGSEVDSKMHELRLKNAKEKFKTADENINEFIELLGID